MVRALIDGVVTKREVEPGERQRVAIARALTNDPILSVRDGRISEVRQKA